MLHKVVIIVFAAIVSVHATVIDSAEYYVDQDPGVGQGVNIPTTPDTVVALSASVDVGSLAPGLHIVGLRVRDNRGLWSLADVRLFYLIGTEHDDHEVLAAEYFFNQDPGAGNGVSLAITPGAEISVTASLDVDALANGLNTLYLRVLDDRGLWSLADSRQFYKLSLNPSQPDIVAAEYFFNQDPGAGNGISLAVAAAPNIAISELIDISSLPYGLNSISLRTRDSRNLWSMAASRVFYTLPDFSGTSDQLLADAEYYVNVDPGPGNGIPFLPEDGAWDEDVEEVSESIAGIPIGRHVLGVRFRDNRGQWSGTVIDSFVVGPLLTILPQSPPVLNWQGENAGAMTYIWRATQTNGPFAVIDSTTTNSFTDNENPVAPSQRFYHVTQQLTTAANRYRLPDPTFDASQLDRVGSPDKVSSAANTRKGRASEKNTGGN
ncbi:hypothetical protein HUU59_13350 [bacterium]|nr:hypothetical protein [bacterium]